jgi:hypothetical protein
LIGNPAGWAYFNELEMSSAMMSASGKAVFAGRGKSAGQSKVNDVVAGARAPLRRLQISSRYAANWIDPVAESARKSADPRGERLQIMLTTEELAALDQWRFSRHMPSRAAAVRELLRRGLAAEGFDVSDGKTKSADFGVIVDIKKKG